MMLVNYDFISLKISYNYISYIPLLNHIHIYVHYKYISCSIYMRTKWWMSVLKEKKENVGGFLKHNMRCVYFFSFNSNVEIEIRW